MKRLSYYALNFFIVIPFFIFSSCKNNKQSNDSIAISYYETGNIKELQLLSEKVPNGTNIKFTADKELSSVGHYISGKKSGLFVKYVKDNLAQIVQYRYSIDQAGKDSLEINQKWTYDGNGSLYKDYSFFYLFSSTPEFPIVSQSFTIEINLVCPPIKNGKMYVDFGNYDENYKLIDSVEYSHIEGVNGIVRKSFVFTNPGVKTIRAIIYSVGEDSWYPIFFATDFTVKEI